MRDLKTIILNLHFYEEKIAEDFRLHNLQIRKLLTDTELPTLLDRRCSTGKDPQ